MHQELSVQDRNVEPLTIVMNYYISFFEQFVNTSQHLLGALSLVRKDDFLLSVPLSGEAQHFTVVDDLINAYVLLP